MTAVLSVKQVSNACAKPQKRRILRQNNILVLGSCGIP
jgi:hypothetical protein